MFLPSRPHPCGSRGPAPSLLVEPVSEHSACLLGKALRGTLSLQGLCSLSFAIFLPFSICEEHSEPSVCIWLGDFLAIS